MKILVVDDSNTARYIAVKVLKELGYKQVSAADSAEKALLLLKSESFDLILLDWHMSGMTGMDFLKILRTDPDTQKINVIMVTTENARDNVVQALKERLQGYIFKPITAAALKSKLKELEQKQFSGS